MRAFVVAAAISVSAGGCWYNLDKHPQADASTAGCTTGTSTTCMNVQPTLSSIQTNVFTANLCSAGACHDGNAATPQGKIDLRSGSASYAHLVGFQSILTPTYQLVVASQPKMSYLLVMIGQVKPQDAMPPASGVPNPPGLMPQNAGGLLCCQKLDAIEMWIANGAMNN